MGSVSLLNAPLRSCARCGQPIPDDAPGGHCPACLIRLAALGTPETGAPGGLSLDAGARRFGDYQLGRQLGAGGMGVVYEARHLPTGSRVALKLVRDDHVASPTQLGRFTLEAEAAARLDHPHIVAIHEVGECDGHPFLSMDFIAGESLSEKVARGEFALQPADGRAATAENRNPQARVAGLLAKVARAVQHAHERGVLHRDLKPGNILIDRQGEPHLTDFGLAKIMQPLRGEARALTASGDLPGTPSYMSPEQVSGLEATTASDIYGLGAILYELLTGRPPFGAPTPLETFTHIVGQPPRAPRHVNPGIHPDLETICLKCLEKDPRRRYSSAAGMAEDLEHWQAGQPIAARPAGAVHRVHQWVRRNRIGTALIGTLCLGLTVALALLKMVNDQRGEIERERDQAFEDGMNRISQIWKDPDTKVVTISARELAILAGRSAAGLPSVRSPINVGVSTDGEPSSMAQRYARLLSSLQQELSARLGEPHVFSLKLFKRFNRDEDSLARGEADFMVLSAVDYVMAKQSAPGVACIARAKQIRDAVIFVHTNAGVQRLSQLAGKSVAFPDPDLSISAWAKARLLEAGIRARDLSGTTNIVDQGGEAGQVVISVAETLNGVLKRQTHAGVTYRDRFERYKHLGLADLTSFPETPGVLAAREGLDPRLIRALSQVVQSLEGTAWIESMSSELPGETVPVDDAYFEGLRRALQQAERFDHD